jgi:hypothetical protein
MKTLIVDYKRTELILLMFFTNIVKNLDKIQKILGKKRRK